ncbi:winged helix-turn-helix transcriptional regulator [Streptomyces lasalocidi]|uniref:Winged helix-turn-helix transcriptional regulator n=2 Tax=Streptomyces lasalocidi TaxID=324833 RepID=A0A4U5WMQ2_STRLS|nr:winged helix-turn-helix transcriptional regulator [Streptomyces lasalocidi]
MGIEYEYMRVANELEAEIKAGRLAPEARLPNERDLGDQYGVSHATARRAVKELRERGLVVTLPNKVSYILPHNGQNGP